MRRLPIVLSLVLALALAAAAGAQQYSFVVTGDGRSATPPRAGMDENGINVTVLRELVKEILRIHPRFVVFNGDLVHGYTTEQEFRGQLEAWLAIMKPVYEAGIHVYPLRGNHDTSSTAAREVWNEVFSGPYALPGDGPAGEKDVTFAAAEANALVVGVDQDGWHRHAVNLGWLEQRLEANTKPLVFVVGHEMAFRSGRHADNLDNNEWLRDAFVKLLMASGARVYFAGHDHFYDRLQVADPAHPGDTLEQIVVGTAGAPFYHGEDYAGDNTGWTVTPVKHIEKTFGYVLGRVDGRHVSLSFMGRSAPGVYAAEDTFAYTAAPRQPAPAADAPAGAVPAPAEGDVTLTGFRFADGETMPGLRIHYRTYGTPRRGPDGVVDNAVLVLHGTTGSGAQFVRPEFAGELFGPGQPLDAARFFIVLPDGIGHGESSKPSDGLRARFPHYGYRDMVEAQYRLLTEGLGVGHLRLVMGTSMGGMQTWMWGELHPGFMDALMPLASLPEQISGRNRVWRRVVIDAIRGDPAWKGGEYATEPPSLRTAAEMLFLVGSNPVLRQRTMPTLAESDEVLDAYVAREMEVLDANDVLYAVAASEDYDPGPDLEKIRAPLLAVNSADDLINPPELGVLEREITRVPRGRAVVIPMSEQTRGHGTHTLAKVWKQELIELLRESAR